VELDTCGGGVAQDAGTPGDAGDRKTLGARRCGRAPEQVSTTPEIRPAAVRAVLPGRDAQLPHVCARLLAPR